MSPFPLHNENCTATQCTEKDFCSVCLAFWLPHRGFFLLRIDWNLSGNVYFWFGSWERGKKAFISLTPVCPILVSFIFSLYFKDYISFFKLKAIVSTSWARATCSKVIIIKLNGPETCPLKFSPDNNLKRQKTWNTFPYVCQTCALFASGITSDEYRSWNLKAGRCKCVKMWGLQSHEPFLRSPLFKVHFHTTALKAAFTSFCPW